MSVFIDKHMIMGYNLNVLIFLKRVLQWAKTRLNNYRRGVRLGLPKLFHYIPYEKVKTVIKTRFYAVFDIFITKTPL